MDLSLLGLKKPGTRGTHPSSQELRDALRDNGDRLDAILLGMGDALQEGVLSGLGLAPTRLSATQVRVPADAAWIDGDGAGGLNGRYRVSWPQTDLTIPAAGTGKRAHRITVPIPAGGHGVSAPVVRSGVDNALAGFTSVSATVGTDGAPNLAAGELQLAGVVSDTAGIRADPNGVQDRRMMARGARFRYATFSGGAARTDITPAAVVANSARRVEANGLNEFVISMRAPIGMTDIGGGALSAAAQTRFFLYRDGSATAGPFVERFPVGSPPSRPVYHSHTEVPPQGSHLYEWRLDTLDGAHEAHVYGDFECQFWGVEHLGGVPNTIGV